MLGSLTPDSLSVAGRASQDPALFRQPVARIKEASYVSINLTTGGALTMRVVERLQPTLQLKPEVE